jgi:hypothetical protein
MQHELAWAVRVAAEALIGTNLLLGTCPWLNFVAFDTYSRPAKLLMRCVAPCVFGG